MLEANHGHIVTVASIAGKAGVAGLVDYCASKHGAVGFHESLTAEIAALRKDVKTTVVCPYYINTGMFDGVETKSPTLLPLLEPEYVVECIMEGILTNRYNVILPRFCHLVVACAGLLPTEVTLILNEYLGANQTMDTFKGRVVQKA
ncbi:unnamed protein product [Caenorhabditis auriculariae]|uniref:Uncharacterized protein n=1 Tax=Caenorhabditis auriculariae TaxID=2777116 RepID=A0A8S1H3X8_9PELO|nr:unnamed protein product [Caenorhabditis auriculariae]